MKQSSGVSIAAMGTQGGNKGGFGNLQQPNQGQENVPVNKPESGNTKGESGVTRSQGRRNKYCECIDIGSLCGRSSLCNASGHLL